MDRVDLFDEQVVSRRAELLGRMVGRRLVRLVRHSWWPAEEALERLREVDATRGPETVFSLTAGPLSVELDSGLILGFGSRPSEASVTVWVERDEAGREGPASRSILRDAELHAIDGFDHDVAEPEVVRCLGHRVERVTLLRRRPYNVLLAQLPRDAGLVIACDDGGPLMPSHGLHDGSDDFSVLVPRLVAPALLPELEEVKL
jgi:hypothetical protein